jgi:hypothetical protein
VNRQIEELERALARALGCLWISALPAPSPRDFTSDVGKLVHQRE